MECATRYIDVLVPIVPPESVDSMAISEKDFRELAIAVEGIKGERRAWTFIPTAAVVVGLAVLGWCWRINDRITTSDKKITAIEQQLADGGSARLVAELRSPKSPEQLQANLSTVVAQVQTARANGKKADQKKVEALSGAVSEVVGKDPQLSEAWQAAGELISFRAPVLGSLNPCAKPEYVRFVTNTGEFGPNIKRMAQFYFKDCVLVLNDKLDFMNSEAYHQFVNTPGAGIGLGLLNVRIVYRGGPIMPVDTIAFVGCTFDFQIQAPPPPTARPLTQTLLAASNINDVKFVSTTPRE
jgi:hypothetical protein